MRTKAVALLVSVLKHGCKLTSETKNRSPEEGVPTQRFSVVSSLSSLRRDFQTDTGRLTLRSRCLPIMGTTPLLAQTTDRNLHIDFVVLYVTAQSILDSSVFIYFDNY
jgi:hypothetical protein